MPRAINNSMAVAFDATTPTMPTKKPAKTSHLPSPSPTPERTVRKITKAKATRRSQPKEPTISARKGNISTSTSTSSATTTTNTALAAILFPKAQEDQKAEATTPHSTPRMTPSPNACLLSPASSPTPGARISAASPLKRKREDDDGYDADDDLQPYPTPVSQPKGKDRHIKEEEQTGSATEAETTATATDTITTAMTVDTTTSTVHAQRQGTRSSPPPSPPTNEKTKPARRPIPDVLAKYKRARLVVAAPLVSSEREVVLLPAWFFQGSDESDFRAGSTDDEEDGEE